MNTNLLGQFLGRYHILEQLGEGGMATVYKARDLNLERDVAVKVIRAENFGSAILERILKRFEREAKSLARLTHPHIVPILDYGETNGAPYLVMPYLPGGTLKGRLKGPIPYREAVQMLIPIAQALVHAHGQGIIHRDIKPSNILITRTGEPMLSDFGIAKILDTEETRDLTSTGVGIGTPEYMAPEQGMGQADERADIYALGIVLYEMITGRIPFRADTPMAILLKKNQEPLPRPSQFVPGLPSSVENVLIKALARDPNNRYQAMRELLDALGRLGRDESVTVEMPREKKNYSMWILAGIGGLIALAVCGIGLFAVGKLLASESPPTKPATLVTQPVPVTPIFTSPPAWTESPVPLPIDLTVTPTLEASLESWSGFLTARMPTLNEIRAEEPVSLWIVNLIDVNDLTRPGTKIYSGTAQRTKEYLFPTYWCAKSAELLSQNMENIETVFLANREVIPSKYIFNYNYDTNTGWYCKYHAVVLGGWKINNEYILEIRRKITKGLSDGEINYRVGEYIYQLNITAR